MRVEIEQLEPDELAKRIREANIKSPLIIQAMEGVFMRGESMNGAAKAAGINYALVHRTVQRLRGICPCCGQTIPKKESV